MISLDISEYGDPLDSRSARVPYSRYLKPQQHKASLGKQFIDNLPPIFEIPQHDMSVTEALKVMRDPEAVVELAQRAPSFVPDCSAGMERLISSYMASALAKFHRDSTPPNRILQRVGHKRMIESTWNNSRRVPGLSWSTPTTSYFDHQECGGLSQCLCPSAGTRGTSPD